MTVIKYMSDLHIDINTKHYDMTNVEIMQSLDLYNVDILVLAGDTAEYPKNLRFIDYISSHYPNLKIVETGSNHLYYSCMDLGMTMKEIDKACKKHNEVNPNYYYLERSTVILDNIKFIGCSMWTTMGEGRTGYMMQIKSRLNDFQYLLTEKDRKFSISDAIELHEKSRRFIVKEVNNTPDNQECIIVTHHAPFYEYYSDVSHAFGIDMSKVMSRFKHQPKCWIYGHSHVNKEKLHNCENNIFWITCNQFGYKGETEFGDQFNAVKTFDSSKRLEM